MKVIATCDKCKTRKSTTVSNPVAFRTAQIFWDVDHKCTDRQLEMEFELD